MLLLAAGNGTLQHVGILDQAGEVQDVATGALLLLRVPSDPHAPLLYHLDLLRVHGVLLRLPHHDARLQDLHWTPSVLDHARALPSDQ